MDSLEIGTGLNPEYNDEPVFYCKHCLSLKIRDAGLPDLLYCDECGSADILTTNIACNSSFTLYLSNYIRNVFPIHINLF